MDTTKQRSGGANSSAARRTILLVLGAVVVLVAIIFGIRYLGYAFAHETTDDAIIDSDQVQVTSKIAERVNSIGTDTNRLVKKGEILITLDDIDERTRLAQALASRDALLAQAQAASANVQLTRATQTAQNAQGTGAIDQARAGIDSAASNARSSASQIGVAKAGVASAAAQVNVAQAAMPGALENYRKAEADLRRTQSLVSTGDVAQANLDSARAASEAARSQYAEAESQVSSAEANLSQAQQRVDSQRFATSSQQAQVGVQEATLSSAIGRLAESSTPERVSTQQANAQASYAQVKTAQSQVAQANVQLGYTVIRSPIDGYVGEKNIEIGATVAPGQSLLTIVPSNSVYVTANYKETQIGKMRVGDSVDLNIDAYHGVPFHGRIFELSPASQNKFALVPAQNATGNFVKVTQRVPIRILFVDDVPGYHLSDYALRPGMSVETSVLVK